MRTSYYRYYPKRRGNTCYTPCAREAACQEWWEHAAPARIERVLAAVLEARKQRAANVSWPAIAENLLFIISEEIVPWQPS